MKYYVYLKEINGEYYYSTDIGDLVHRGDVIALGGEKFIVIGGQCLPRRESVA